MAKFLIILMAVGVAIAYPAADEVRPSNAIGTQSQSLSDAPILLSEQVPGADNPEQGSVSKEGKPESSDLKTDSSFWWGGTYYPFPFVYARPRVYGYYGPYGPYYWNSYW